MKDYSSMTKDQIIAELNKANEEVAKTKAAAGGRKLQVLTALRETGHTTVEALAKEIGISARNISSQLTYLRKDGIAIATDSLGRKFIESEPEETKLVEKSVEKPAEKPATILKKQA